MCHRAYPEADEDVKKLHLPADVYKMWKRIRYREPHVAEKHINYHIEMTGNYIFIYIFLCYN